MQTFTLWKWKKVARTVRDQVKRANMAKVFGLALVNEPVDWSKVRRSDTVLVTGDAFCLGADIRRFESWGAAHDIFAVNRSMLFLEKPILHWCAVDAEESVWFTGNLNAKICPPGHRIWRHTVGVMPLAYDFFWAVVVAEEGDYSGIWVGNSGYFAILACIGMGYERIVIAGMPLDNQGHWYEPEGTDGPRWIGRAYTQWMDFKMKVPAASRVRSMSGYTAFMLGQATEEWAHGDAERVEGRAGDNGVGRRLELQVQQTYGLAGQPQDIEHPV